MESIYIILSPDGYPFAGTYEESRAIEMCQQANNLMKGHTYCSIPFSTNPDTEITVISNAVIKPKNHD